MNNTLERKLIDYRNWLVQDDYGFIDSEHCDSLLWTGLVGSCEHVHVGIDAAYDEVWDEWRRRPVAYECCYDPSTSANQEGLFSKLFRIVALKLQFPLVSMADVVKANWYEGSTISRDMLIGLAWFCWHNKRRDIADNIIDRALTNFGVMGRGDPSRINIMPALLSTFAWISYKLGGPSRPLLRAWMVGAGGKLTDFEAHLQVLHLMLRRDISGKISSRGMKTLRYHADRQPTNALFQAAVGNNIKALGLLDRQNWFPSNHLPTSVNRSEPWLFQRDYGLDWLPDPELPVRGHSGADFVFLYSYLTGRMRK